MRRRRSGTKTHVFRRESMRHVIVMVLGDAGRSPRMQYHALSLARMSPSLRVTLLGYTGENCMPDVVHQSNITSTSEGVAAATAVALAAAGRGWQRGSRAFAKSTDANVDVGHCRIPTFVVAWLCCRLKGAKFVIDWHNIGYSLLALALGSGHPVVKMAKWVERVFGRKADANLCVTHEMQTWLKNTWQIDATVLHDKPPLFFRPTPLDVQHELLTRVGDQLKHCNDVRALYFLVTWGEDRANLEETLLTRKIRVYNKNKSKVVVLARKNRPAMIISSTSWTADEDFGVLLAALELLDECTSSLSVSEFPNLLVVVTGKGPQKDMYLNKIRSLAFKRIRIATMWLEASDYPLILGSADVGVCLHTSSSGLDLPMKVLDMFGCGLPVCAIRFKCLDELVKHNKNGLVFDSSKELSAQLYGLLKGYPHSNVQLDRLRASVKKVKHWPENWSCAAAPVFKLQLKLV